MCAAKRDMRRDLRHYEISRGIVSLLNMLSFYADHWITTTATLSQAIGQIVAGGGLRRRHAAGVRGLRRLASQLRGIGNKSDSGAN